MTNIDTRRVATARELALMARLSCQDRYLWAISTNVIEPDGMPEPAPRDRIDFVSAPSTARRGGGGARNYKGIENGAAIMTEFVVGAAVSVVIAGLILSALAAALVAAGSGILFVIGAAPILAIASRSFAPIGFVLDLFGAVLWLGVSPVMIIMGKRR